MINIKLGNKPFKVKEAISPKEKEQGLMNINSLPKDEGMIFYWEEPSKVSMWMHNTNIPLDIIFINDD